MKRVSIKSLRAFCGLSATITDLDSKSNVYEHQTSLTTTVVKGIGISWTGHTITQVFTLITYLVLARLATPSDFGVFAAGSILVSIGAMVAGSGMSAALIQRKNERMNEAASTAFVATLTAGLIIGILSLVCAPLIGIIFNSEQVAWVTVAMSGYMIFRELVTVPEAIMQRRFSFGRRIVIEPIGALANCVMAIAACAAGLGVWGLVIGIYSSLIIQAIVAWLLIAWRPNLRQFSFQMWREMASYGRYIVVGGVVENGTAQFSTILLGIHLNTATIGQFNYAYRVTSQSFAAMVNSTAYVVMPAMSRIQHETERMRRAFVRAVQWVSAVSFPISFYLLIFGTPLMVLVFGGKWSEAGAAVSAMFAFTGARSLDSIAKEVLKATGRPHQIPKINIVLALTTIVFMLGLVFPFGLVGVAIAVSIGSVIGASYCVLLASRVIELPIKNILNVLWQPLLACVGASLIMYPTETLLANPTDYGTLVGFLLLGLESIFFAALYLVLVCLISRDLRLGLRVGLNYVLEKLNKQRMSKSLAS